MIYKFLLAILILSSAFSCKSQKFASAIDLGSQSKLILLDSIHASTAIVTDESDHFFDRVTITEMEIQMKTAKQYKDRAQCSADYKTYLMSDVGHFTTEEITKITEVFQHISKLIQKVNPSLLNKNIELIKTKGKHYGDGVFYTRENKIIIPANELRNFDKDKFTDVMLHEIFHIFSRYNLEAREKIYSLIGFRPMNSKIIYPEILAKRKLLNPDGTTDYLIELEDINGRSVIAYPLISADSDHFQARKPSFMQYLHFELYELQPMEDALYKLLADEKGHSTIPFNKIPAFFTSIKDNTQYIIHPDEISADNFIYTIYYVAEGKKVKNFSIEGMKLIDEIAEVLTEFKN